MKHKYLLAISILFLSSQMKGKLLQCDQSKIMSPINLEMPLPYEKFSPSIRFVLPDGNLQMEKIEPNVFKMQGNFGYIQFLEKTREIKEVYFKSPSEHTVQGVKFGMEMQIYAPGDNNDSGVILSKLFQAGDRNNDDLKMLGFGSGKLKSLDIKDIFGILHPVNLKKLQGESEAFINYQGEATIGDCEMVEWIISVETGDIGKDQLKEFRDALKDQKVESKTALSSMRVTQNFNEKLKIKVKKRTHDIKKLSKLRGKSKKYKGKMDIMEKMGELNKLINNNTPISEVLEKKKKEEEKKKKKLKEKKEEEKKKKKLKKEKEEKKKKIEEEKEERKIEKEIKNLKKNEKIKANKEEAKKFKMEIKNLQKEDQDEKNLKKAVEKIKKENEKKEIEKKEEEKKAQKERINQLKSLEKETDEALKKISKVEKDNLKQDNTHTPPIMKKLKPIVEIKRKPQPLKVIIAPADPGIETPQKIKSQELKQEKVIKKKQKKHKNSSLKFIKTPQGRLRMYKILQIGDERIIKVPKNAEFPWRLKSKKFQKKIKNGEIELILTSPDLYPTPEEKDLKFRAIYYYKDAKNKERYIPYLVKVPKDFTPNWDSTVMALPVSSSESKKIAIKHLRRTTILAGIFGKNSKKKAKESEEKPNEKKIKNKRICMKWGLKIVIDKKGNPWRGRKCIEWREITEENFKTIFEEKDKNILNSMGSMKWVVRGLTNMIGASKIV